MKAFIFLLSLLFNLKLMANEFKSASFQNDLNSQEESNYKISILGFAPYKDHQFSKDFYNQQYWKQIDQLSFGFQINKWRVTYQQSSTQDTTESQTLKVATKINEKSLQLNYKWYEYDIGDSGGLSYSIFGGLTLGSIQFQNRTQIYNDISEQDSVPDPIFGLQIIQQLKLEWFIFDILTQVKTAKAYSETASWVGAYRLGIQIPLNQLFEQKQK